MIEARDFLRCMSGTLMEWYGLCAVCKFVDCVTAGCCWYFKPSSLCGIEIPMWYHRNLDRIFGSEKETALDV